MIGHSGCLLRHGIEGKHCIDIGPGTGRWLTFLKQNNAAYLAAIDISGESLNRCAALCNKTQKADLESDAFDFESDFFDVVLCFEVLEHLTDPENFITEVGRVVKNGGLILMSVPNVVSLGARIRMLLGILPLAVTADSTHVRFYRKKDIQRLFSAHGLNPTFIPTSISLNPLKPKSRFRIPSCRILSSLDDTLLFVIHSDKTI